MLIECGHCGAPLDIRPGQAVSKCRYCGSSNRVAQARALAQSTPGDWRPPKQWRPPQHVPADSSRVLRYKSGNTALWIAVSTAFVVLLLGIGAGGFVFLRARGEAAAQRELERAMQRTEQAVHDQLAAARRGSPAGADPTAAEPAPEAELAAASLFTGRHAAELAAKFREHLGGRPVRALELALYPSYAFLEAQDPKAPKNVDRYSFRDGRFGDSEPVPLSFVHGKLENNLFDLEQVALEKLPELIKTTLTRLSYEKGEVSHVLVERNLPFTKNVVIRVYVSGPRESGRIDFTAEGKIQRIFK